MSPRPRAANARLASVAITLALAASSCARSHDEPGSCTRALISSCVEYPTASAAAGKRMCTDGVWSAGRCAREGALGACAREHGAYVELLYGGPPNQYTADVAAGVCRTTGGEWRAL